VELSLLRPKDLGYPFSRWSLDKLRLAILVVHHCGFDRLFK